MAKNYYAKMNPEISGEEKKYREAVSLVDSLDCILRFEWRVKSLKTAFDIFSSLGDYKDSKEQAEQCREMMLKRREQGYEEVFSEAVSKQNHAETKSNYADAIADFKRVLQSDTYKEQAKEHIAECKKAIRHIETVHVWRKRGVAFLVLLVLAFLFYRSPAYPFIRGLIFQNRGNYKSALVYYEHAKDFPFTEKQIGKCYLEIGKKRLEKGKKKSALKAFRKAEGNGEAQKYVADMEKEILQEISTGEVTRFGKRRWLVLKKDENHVLLFCLSKGGLHAYYAGENMGFWDSHIGHFINRYYKKYVFSNDEKNMLEEIEPATQTKNQKSYKHMVSAFTKEEYESYQDLLPETDYRFWLKDDRKGKNVYYVDGSHGVKEIDGTEKACYVRPVIYVKINDK